MTMSMLNMQTYGNLIRKRHIVPKEKIKKSVKSDKQMKVLQKSRITMTFKCVLLRVLFRPDFHLKKWCFLFFQSSWLFSSQVYFHISCVHSFVSKSEVQCECENVSVSVLVIISCSICNCASFYKK